MRKASIKSDVGIPLALTLGVILFGWGPAFAGPPADLSKDRTIEIYWANQPPVIDGKMDDPAWRDASCAKDFGLFKKAGSPTRKTEVYVCYDAENLYLFWKLFEAQMDKFKPGPPPDMKDVMGWEDAVELFLDPGRTRKEYCQLAASGLGAQWDYSSRKKEAFNPNWRAKGGQFDGGPGMPKLPSEGGPVSPKSRLEGRDEGGWTLEMAVPFTELVQVGEFLGTPQPGDCWGINFCRDQNLHEWSQWTTSMVSFHEMENFGQAIFKGRRDGQPLPVVRLEAGAPLFFGPGARVFGVQGNRGACTGTATILHNGQVVSRNEVPLKGDRWPIAYDLAAGGEWRCQVDIAADQKPVYRALCLAKLPPVKETVEEIQRAIGEGQGRLDQLAHPVAPELRQKMRGLQETTRLSAARLAKNQRLSRDDWKALVKDAELIQQKWKRLKFDLNLARLYPVTGKPAGFAVGALPPEEKLYPDTVYTGGVDGAVRCALAGNEYESFQLVVLPFWKSLKTVSVSFSDLVGKAGTIGASNLAWFAVDYVTLDTVNPDQPDPHGQEPDILWRGKPFAVPRGEVRSLWMDVFLPPGTPAGDYRGQAVVAADGETVTREIVAHAHGFDLPAKPTLKINHWYMVNYLRYFYGTLAYTPELYEKHAAVLARYRAAAFPMDMDGSVIRPQIQTYTEPNGHFTFDWTVLDQYLRIGLQHGANAFWSALTCHLGVLTPFTQPSWPVKDRSTGKAGTLAPYIKEWQERKLFYDEHPVYRDYLTEYTRHLKELGLLPISYWEIYDEPNTANIWIEMIRHHTFLKKHVPELKLLCWGANPLQVKGNQSAVGLMDGWGPMLNDLADQPGLLDELYRRRKEHGEEFWFYVCSSRKHPKGQRSPYIYYDEPSLGARLLPWMAWKYQVDGFTIFATTWFPPENNVKEAEKRWPKVPWHSGKYRGCGVLVYPGPDQELVPSIRLAHVRDGMEDYEYFQTLRAGAARLDPARQADLLKEVQRELAIETDIIGDAYHWTTDLGALNAKRQRLAAIIGTLTSAQSPSAKTKLKNIALGKTYTVDTPANYPMCTDDDDAIQLTDGKPTEGFFWTSKPTVGWQQQQRFSNEFAWTMLCPPEELVEYRRLIDEAKAAAPPESIYRKRIQFIDDALWKAIILDSSNRVRSRMGPPKPLEGQIK